MAYQDNTGGKPFTGWHMLAIMVLFFGTIIGVNLIMASSAIRTWTGLVVENSYVASQEFNTKLANARAQIEAGWQGGLSYEAGALRFTLVDGQGEPLPAETVTVAVSRPIGAHGDRTIVLERAAGGSYHGVVALQPGAWNAAIRATFAGQPAYEHHARLNVRAADGGRP